jgi:4-aminobutyrate aminotransferase-like enzyme
MWSPAAGLLAPSADGIIDFFFLPDLLEQALARHRGEVAAVVIAPDYTYLRRETLARLAEIARSHEVLICCDDVKQGFRRRAGSEWPEATGRQADLYVFSKGLANGQRLSCVVGRRELLDHARNFTYTAYFDPVPIVAALATLREMERQSGHALLVARGLRLIERLRERFRAAELAAEVRGSGPLFQFVFADAALEDAFHRECLAGGLLLFEGDNQALSLAIDDREADALVDRIDAVCDRLRSAHGRRGGVIGPERWFGAAWNMIDGATDEVPVTDALAWIRREMGWP